MREARKAPRAFLRYLITYSDVRYLFWRVTFFMKMHFVTIARQLYGLG